MMSFRIQSGAAAVLAMSLLVGCSSKKDVEPPAELTDFRSTAKVEKLWTANAGDGAPKLRLGLFDPMIVRARPIDDLLQRQRRGLGSSRGQQNHE